MSVAQSEWEGVLVEVCGSSHLRRVVRVCWRLAVLVDGLRQSYLYDEEWRFVPAVNAAERPALSCRRPNTDCCSGAVETAK